MGAKEIYIIPEKEYRLDYESSLREIIREELTLIKGGGDSEVKEESYLTRKETATRLRISLPTLGEYVKKGIIKSSKVGSRVLFREDDVTSAIRGIKTKIQ